MTVFVPGPLYNPQASDRGGTWHKRARWARQWRERTTERLRVHLLTELPRRVIDPATPKAIQFHAIVFNRFDSDNLETALKPCRDGLKDARIINDDRDSAGHTFAYTQQIDRKGQRGVRITIIEWAGKDGCVAFWATSCEDVARAFGWAAP